MNEFDPYDDEANLRAAQESVLAERAQARIERVLNARPARFAAEGDLHPAIAAWCERAAGRSADALILIGGVGTGKTWSCWKAAETLARGGWNGRFDIVDAYDLKDAMRSRDPRDRDQVDIWAGADILAVDDIGAVGLHDWDAENLHRVVNDRWKEALPTVITSNSADLKPLLGPRVASRLADGATIVKLGGADRRREQ